MANLAIHMAKPRIPTVTTLGGAQGGESGLSLRNTSVHFRNQPHLLTLTKNVQKDKANILDSLLQEVFKSEIETQT